MKENPALEPIITTSRLEEVCTRFAGDPFVAVDTEFMRETTFWPILCLIQIAGPSGEVLIDPLADGIELKAFYDLMADESVVKVFHAARQDIEIVHSQADIIPSPLFDSQIAAMVCGFGDSIGYEALIRALLDKGIDKTSRFTDWSRRPLSQKQLAYALADVTHLREAYPLLDAQLQETGRQHWVEQEMAILENPATYISKPEDAWKRLKFNANSKKARAVFMDIAAWRENEAQTRDVPRNRILKEDALREIALQCPNNVEELAVLRAVPKGFANSSRARGLLEAVQKGLNKPDDEIFEQKPNGPPRKEVGSITEMLKVLLKIMSIEHGVATKLIASSADIEKIAFDDKAHVPALSGWRYELFGEKALALKHGHVALALKDGQPILIDFK